MNLTEEKCYYIHLIINSTNFLLVPRGSEGPLVEMGVNIAVIATEGRVQDLVRDVKGVHERDSLLPDLGQQGVEETTSHGDVVGCHVAVLYGMR